MERLRRIKAHLSLWWRASRSLSLLRLLLALCSPVIFYLAIMAQADLITALTRGTTWQEAWPKLLWVIATMLATPLMGFLATIVDAHLQLRYTVLFQTMLAEAALHPHGIERLENPDSTAELKSLTTESRQWYSLNNIQLTMAIFGSRLNGIVAFFIVTRWNLWAALAVTAAILLASHSFMRYLKQIIDRWMSTSKEGRQSAEYSRKITTNREAGKEVRLFDLTNFAINRYTHGHLDSLRQEWRTRSKNFWPTLASNVVYLVIFATAVTMLILQAFDGVIAVGAMFAIFQGLEGISSLGPQGDAQIHVTRAEGYASSLLAIREKAGLARIPQRRSDEFVLPPPPLRGAADISLTNVSFTYPSREDPVFQGLSLDIPAGQHIAIVGVNGAGKSTLIKLLTGLYAPSSGSITIGGVDPHLDDAARRRVAVVFQDFVRYELSLRDNITLGTGEAGDEARALHNAAGDSILERVDGDWDTILATGYENGTDLSGGQWQRVALARAFAASLNGAGILVLDEPTAALDIRAEAELFERFLNVTEGITSILISHRLSSVRNADRIVVLDSGGVIEDGTHDELLAQQGKYAEMFTIQAQRFTQTGNVDESTEEDTYV